MDKLVVIYDHDCEFCRRSVEWLKKKDKKSVLDFVPCQSERREKEFSQVSQDQCLSAIQVVLPDQRVLSGFDGIIYIMKFLSGLKLLGFLLNFLGIKILGRLAYYFIAKNRYKISCKDNHCQTHFK